MKILGMNNIVKILAVFTAILISCIGCVTIDERPPTEGLTKSKIQQGWGRRPDKVYTTPNKLKYGADELWEYEYPGGGSIDRFYFKDNILIKEEHVTYGDL